MLFEITHATGVHFQDLTQQLSDGNHMHSFQAHFPAMFTAIHKSCGW